MGPDRIAQLRAQWPEAADIVEAAVVYVRAADARDVSARKLMGERERQHARAEETRALHVLRQAVRSKPQVKQEGMFGG
jgi:hypothetical protein